MRRATERLFHGHNLSALEMKKILWTRPCNMKRRLFLTKTVLPLSLQELSPKDRRCLSSKTNPRLAPRTVKAWR